MRAVTIKTEPPDYVEQDGEPSSHLVSVKSEPDCYEEVGEPNSLDPTFTKDYADVTKVAFHFNAEPQVSEETRRRHNTAVAVKIEPPDPTEVHSKAVSAGTACAAPSFALPLLPHPVVQQSSASQGGPRGALQHSLPALQHFLLLLAPRNMAAPKASISSATTTSAVAKRGRGRPRQYTADELRERLNAAKRAKRQAAKSTLSVKSSKTRCKSPNTRRAERAAAQRARRQNEAIRKREREADRKAKRLKRRQASMSTVAANSAVVKYVQGDSDTQESGSMLPNDGSGWGSSNDNSSTEAVTIKTEPPPCAESPDPTEVHSEAVSTGTGLDGSSGNTAMTAVTIKPEAPDYVEQDEDPCSHLVSVKSELECYEEVWEPGNPVPALTNGERPDYTDVTKVTFHAIPELQVSKGAQQCGNAAVAVKIERQDPMEVYAPAIFLGAGLGAGAPTEFQQDLVPTNPIGSYAVAARPLQWVPTSVCDEAQPQANVIYFHNVEQHGIATQPVVVTLPVVAVQPERLDVAPPWLVGLGSGAASSQEVGQHRVLVVPTVAVRPP
uniref:Uncharacterized protein n=1 Tax=Ixodes ricinus TaxID=34613 RepID=A0A6B0VFI9_IXORI